MSNDWTDRLAGARMRVDREFQDKLDDSEFTNQEWGLVMTAIDFEVEHPEDRERAELVANTEKLSEIVPELENIQREMGGSPRPVESAPTGDGMLGRLKQYLHHLRSNASDSSDEERLAAAKVLVDEYAADLQTYLEKHERWDEIREAAAEA